MAGDNSTLDWYRDHLDEFIAGTVNADMTDLYNWFLKHIHPGGYIMDLGCGAGAASLYFTQQGYRVLAIDGCRELCDFTHQHAGCSVRAIRFDELDYTNEFDGIWACASLLHVHKAELPGILRLIRQALKKAGIFYASFKYGDTEREKGGREFSDFTEESLRAMLDDAGGYRVIDLRITNDVRPGRSDERWVNVLCLAE